MRLMLLCPIPSPEYNRVFAGAAKVFARKDTEVEVVSVEKGPESVESFYQASMAEPFTLEKIRQAETRGFDAVAIGCMCDVGLYAGRELVKIPVTGAGESSVLIASALASKMGFVTLGLGTQLDYRVLKLTGLESRLVSLKTVSIRALDVIENIDKTKQAVLEAGHAALKDGAQVIVFGCGGMSGMAHWLQNQLKIPVVDPLGAAIKMAELLVDLKLAQSKLAYPEPPQMNLASLLQHA